MKQPLNGRVAGLPAWAWGLLAAAIVAAVYRPALGFPFMPFWDDDIHVHSNPHIANLSWSGIAVFWSGPWQQLYIPLTYSTWAGLAALSRWAHGLPSATGPLDAAWFHGANVAVHAVSVFLAYVLILGVTGKFFPRAPQGRLVLASVTGALFFGLHPLQVEAVAWVSGLRDVLGGCLGLAALAVLFGRESPGPWRWTAATALYAASLAAKPAGVALVLAAAVLAVAPFRWPPRRVALLLPWLVIGGVWVLVTSNAQWAAELARNLVPVWVRPLVATDALSFYLSKAVWPSALAADYGRSPDVARAAGWIWWTWLGPAAVAAVLVMRPLRIYIAPAAIFAAALLPTLGLVPFNFQVVSTVADRYAYAALLGPALALAMVIAQTRSTWVAAAGMAWVAALAALTVQRLPLWSEDVKLFAATLQTNPQSWKAMHNYASALDDRGRTAEAEPLLREVIARRPDSAEAHNDLAVVLWRLGRRNDAVQAMRRSLQLRPTAGSARNLARMEAQLGNAAGMAAALEILLQIDPGDIEALRQLNALRAQGPL